MTLRWLVEAKNELLVQLSQIEPEMVLEGAGYIAGAWLTMFATKTLVTAIARSLGLSHPAHYRLWPRLPWRAPYKFWLILKQWHERIVLMNRQSTGGLAGMLTTLTQLYKPHMLFLGRAYAFGIPLLQPIGGVIRTHCMIYAQSGAGKSVLLITMIACWLGSVFVIDPKGQIVQALADYDKRRTWYVFDPHDITGRKSVSINVMDIMVMAMEEQGEDAGVLWAFRIAEALIVTPEGTKTPFFYNTPRGLLVAVILHTYTYHEKECWNLPFVYDLLTNGYRVFNSETGEEETNAEEAFAYLLLALRNNTAFNGLISTLAAAFESAGKETLGNLKATLYESIKWLAIPSVRAKLLKSDFDFRDLKRQNDIVFACVASVFSIREELSRLFRLVINMSAYCFEYEKKKNGQCLYVVDELPSMGYNPTIEILLAVFRSMGISFVGISQDLELHQKAYPKSWRAFSGNADFVLWMATNEKQTSQYCSDLLGKKTIVETDNQTGRKFYREISTLDDDQVRRFLSPESGRIILTSAGKRAKVLVNDPYFRALSIFNYAPDPDHKEAFLRAFMRKILRVRPIERRIEQEPQETKFDFEQDPVNTPKTKTQPSEKNYETQRPAGSNVIPFRRPETD
ncbi:type IV secretory pathway TraG/TraD family ATPase VirD4 [Alteromonadaceae bacterium 2753L.S.0a.02]|nr:type IV secretory pathway TraG/TraD family ATPase VirD4 [Alteromonadaceae bacterium 2753L.S.0a.02]